MSKSYEIKATMTGGSKEVGEQDPTTSMRIASTAGAFSIANDKVDGKRTSLPPSPPENSTVANELLEALAVDDKLLLDDDDDDHVDLFDDEISNSEITPFSGSSYGNNDDDDLVDDDTDLDEMLEMFALQT